MKKFNLKDKLLAVTTYIFDRIADEENFYGNNEYYHDSKIANTVKSFSDLATLPVSVRVFRLEDGSKAFTISDENCNGTNCELQNVFDLEEWFEEEWEEEA